MTSCDIFRFNLLHDVIKWDEIGKDIDNNSTSSSSKSTEYDFDDVWWKRIQEFCFLKQKKKKIAFRVRLAVNLKISNSNTVAPPSARAYETFAVAVAASDVVATVSVFVPVSDALNWFWSFLLLFFLLFLIYDIFYLRDFNRIPTFECIASICF